MKLSTISAVLPFLMASASARKTEARQMNYAQFTLEGFHPRQGESYNLSVPEDGSTVSIGELLDRIP